jgi:hypothetical protein
MTLRPIVYRHESMDRVLVAHHIGYDDADAARTFDLYTPPGTGPHPAVVLVTGYPDAGGPLPLGCAFKEMELSRSLARVIAAACDAAVVTYTARHPAADLARLRERLERDAGLLGLDPSRLGLWAVSGHVPVALAALMDGLAGVRAAVLSNGFTLDDAGSAVADAARTFGFANPCAGRRVEDLPAAVPMFVVRSGRDQFPGLNEALDRFVAGALAANLPITVVNHAAAAHAFELFDDTEVSRHLVRQMLAFIRFWLNAGTRT